MLGTKLSKVYRFYKKIRAKRDAAEVVGSRGPEKVDSLQGAVGWMMDDVYVRAGVAVGWLPPFSLPPHLGRSGGWVCTLLAHRRNQSHGWCTS